METNTNTERCISFLRKSIKEGFEALDSGQSELKLLLNKNEDLLRIINCKRSIDENQELIALTIGEENFKTLLKILTNDK